MYYHGGRPNYYYADYKVYTNIRFVGIFFILFAVSWLLISMPIVFSTFSITTSSPLPLNYNTSIVIDDELGIVDDRVVLSEAFGDFQEKTGVTLSLVTKSPENVDTRLSYSTLAYRCYVSRWIDESHWLIYYVGDSLDRSDDWNWELMCGDDCTEILSTTTESEFIRNFQRYLEATDQYTFTGAVLAALDEIEIHTVNVNVNPEYILFIIFPIIGIVMLILGIRLVLQPVTDEDRAKNRAVEIKSGTICREVSCRHCGGVYVLNTCTKCPYCDAPIGAEELSPDHQLILGETKKNM